jgi:CheY-like chemotaxis protein
MAKILLVEDDKALREIYGVRLLAEGYDIVSAGDGEEALAVAIREKPVLIISDVMMPKISGFEMLDLLRSNDATKNIKVVMMTALSGDQHRERGEGLGADRYLVKSQVGIEDVVNTVHEVLGDKAAALAETPQSVEPTPGATTPPAPAPAAPAPATPAPNQSPINPPVATSPSSVVGVPAPDLPATPPNIPVVTTPTVPTRPPSALAPTPIITPVADTPTAPTLQVPVPGLPPVAPPSSDASTPTDSIPSFQPRDGEAPDNGGETSYKPAADLALSSSHVGTRIIQPTGESITPKVNMDDLVANEEAKDIMSQPAAPQPPVAASPPAPPPANNTAEVQVDPSGAIGVDSLPSTPSQDITTFPNQPQ